LASRRGGGEGLTPFLLAALAAVAVGFFALPLAGLAVRAPWHEAWDQLTRPEALMALRLSLVVSLCALALSLVLGAPLAWALARPGWPGRRVVRAIVVLPMVLPPVVAGVGLLTALGRRGLAGGVLQAVGISLPFTTAAAVVAAAFVAAPFLVVTLEAGFRAVDTRLEDAAATLGASRLMIFRTVTLPATAPALVAGSILCWARALGEFGATIVFAGNLAGTTQTAPLAIYQELQTGDFGGAVLLSLMLFSVSLTVLVALRTRVVAR
jgi:molybdate transport system permease protein